MSDRLFDPINNPISKTPEVGNFVFNASLFYDNGDREVNVAVAVTYEEFEEGSTDVEYRVLSQIEPLDDIDEQVKNQLSEIRLYIRNITRKQ